MLGVVALWHVVGVTEPAIPRPALRSPSWIENWMSCEFMSATIFGTPVWACVSEYGRSPQRPIAYSNVLLFDLALPPAAIPTANPATASTSTTHTTFRIASPSLDGVGGERRVGLGSSGCPAGYRPDYVRGRPWRPSGGRAYVALSPQPHVERDDRDDQAADAENEELAERVRVLDEPAEVLPEEARQERQRQEHRCDQCQLPHALVLAHARLGLLRRDHGHVGLENRGQQVPLSRDFLVDEAHVVVDVPEVRHEWGVDGDERPTLEHVERCEERMHGSVEVARLAPEEVDPLGRRNGAREHRRFDVLDVTLEPFDDGCVVVYDLVEDRPEHRRGPSLEELRVLLEPKPCAVQLAPHALPNRDDEPWPEEDADLAELHLLPCVVIAGGSQNHELQIAVEPLELGAKVKRLGVLHRELMQVEGLSDLGELLGLRLEEPEPDEASLVATRGSLLELQRALVLPAAVPVVRTVDDHRFPLARCRTNPELTSSERNRAHPSQSRPCPAQAPAQRRPAQAPGARPGARGRVARCRRGLGGPPRRSLRRDRRRASPGASRPAAAPPRRRCAPSSRSRRRRQGRPARRDGRRARTCRRRARG